MAMLPSLRLDHGVRRLAGDCYFACGVRRWLFDVQYLTLDAVMRDLRASLNGMIRVSFRRFSNESRVTKPSAGTELSLCYEIKSALKSEVVLQPHRIQPQSHLPPCTRLAQPDRDHHYLKARFAASAAKKVPPPLDRRPQPDPL